MKPLILTCNTGEGHNSVSSAIEEAFAVRNIESTTVDALSFLSKSVSEFICNWHVRFYRHMPKLYRSGYRMAELHPAAFEEKSAVHRFIASGADRLRDFIVSGGYDCIICPHVIPSLMVTAMLSKNRDMKLLTCNVATDNTCSPMTEESRLNLYFIPDEQIKDEFVNAGVPEEKIVCCQGIPVRRDFYTIRDKAAAKTQLGISEDAGHVLMMFGSMGCGPMFRLTELLSEMLPDNACLTVVCGTNDSLRRKLSFLCHWRKNIRILGYADDISLLMDSADVYLTKPGGISTAEAAVKGLPMVLANIVSGCEEYNLRLFCRKGGAVTADTTEGLARLCTDLLSDRSKLTEMSRSLMRAGNSADMICDRLIEESKKAK